MFRAILALVILALAAAPALAQTGTTTPQVQPPSSSPSTLPSQSPTGTPVTVRGAAALRDDVADRSHDGAADQPLAAGHLAGHAVGLAVVRHVAVDHAAAARVLVAEPAGGPAARARLALIGSGLSR